MTENSFTFPIDFDPESLPRGDERVCIVSIIGKQRLYNHKSKATRINAIFGKEVFQTNGDATDCELEGYYDPQQKVIFLHLQSIYDASTLSSLCQHADRDIDQGGSSAFEEAEHKFAKSLILLFSISHLILIVHPGKSFDISYVRLFRVLESIRYKLQGSICEHLKALRVGKEWYMAGRPCSPRVLFLFDSCSLTREDLAADQIVMSKTRSQKTPPIKRLQHAIEDQIYKILRKARIITNISNNSLFAVPANQEFVYVCANQEDVSSDLITSYMEQLRSNCTTVREGDTPRSKSYQVNRRVNQTSHVSRQTTNPVSFEHDTLNDFLAQHIDLALSKGFDDNVGRNPVSSVFHLPTSEMWFKTSNALFKMFMLEPYDSKTRPQFTSLKSLMDINQRFSDGRCSKILPMAETAYQEGLPPHYTKTYHIKKLQQAKRIFLQHARGPACDKYIGQLEQACDKLWQNGRQLCEEISITGNHCVHQLHRLPTEDETDENGHLPLMAHVSQLKTRGTCNCGAKQMDRDDPFDHKAANFEFFQKLGQGCCVKLENYDLPVFKASVPEARAHKALVAKSSSGDIGSPLLERKSSAPDNRELSIAFSLGHSAGSDVFDNTNFNPDASQDVIVPFDNSPSDLDVLRQLSTTEYLPSMVHSDSPSGLLPLFPSWSLICLGKSSLYLPNLGVDQPNFSHQCNFLLPHDVTVKADQERWPSVHETSSKKSKQFKRTMAMDYVVRMYFGFEYECPRGHRFFLSGPDKIFKAPPTGIFKETAIKVLNSHMPMYYPCNCRSSKGYMGQLMRFHCVIPEGPILQLNAKIRPGPGPTPCFLPNSEGVITLPHEGWWLLRFPYVYVGEKGAYLMPKEASKVIECQIQKNIIRVVNET